MEGSRLFRIESKMFEVAMSKGDSRFRLHIYERGRYFLRLVFFLLGNCEKDFLKTFREGENCFHPTTNG